MAKKKHALVRRAKQNVSKTTLVVAAPVVLAAIGGSLLYMKFTGSGKVFGQALLGGSIGAASSFGTSKLMKLPADPSKYLIGASALTGAVIGYGMGAQELAKEWDSYCDTWTGYADPRCYMRRNPSYQDGLWDTATSYWDKATGLVSSAWEGAKTAAATVAAEVLPTSITATTTGVPFSIYEDADTAPLKETPYKDEDVYTNVHEWLKIAAGRATWEKMPVLATTFKTVADAYDSWVSQKTDPDELLIRVKQIIQQGTGAQQLPRADLDQIIPVLDSHIRARRWQRAKWPLFITGASLAMIGAAFAIKKFAK